jgi:hypothetical protein
MKGIYLTEQGKQEIEAKIAELEKYQHTSDDIEGYSDEDCFYIGERSGEIFTLKEILASVIVLPEKSNWIIRELLEESKVSIKQILSSIGKDGIKIK